MRVDRRLLDSSSSWCLAIFIRDRILYAKFIIMIVMLNNCMIYIKLCSFLIKTIYFFILRLTIIIFIFHDKLTKFNIVIAIILLNVPKMQSRNRHPYPPNTPQITPSGRMGTISYPSVIFATNTQTQSIHMHIQVPFMAYNIVMSNTHKPGVN